MNELVLGWIKNHSPSGVLNWHDGQVYNEVTGYLIPTMLKWGEIDLALQYREYLLESQNPDGTWNGIDGKVRVFDTAACYEGLLAIGETEVAENVKNYLQTLYLDNGALPIEPGGDLTHIYTARASGLINSRLGRDYWQFDGGWDMRWGSKQRTHYIAYGLEGLEMLGVDISEPLQASIDALGKDNLMPYWIEEDWSKPQGTDVTATCQMAMLYARNGMDAESLIKAVEKLIRDDGGVPQTKDDMWPVSWAAKFYLDAKHELER